MYACTSMEEMSFGIKMSRTVTVNDLQPFNHFIYDYPLKSKNPITGTNPKKNSTLLKNST